MTTKFGRAVLAAVLLGVAALPDVPAHAAGMNSDMISLHGIGSPGKPADAARSVTVVMRDNYFEPEQIEVVAGETVRLAVRNDGALVHELHIGTPQMQSDRQAMMQMMVDHGVIQGGRIDRAVMKMDMGGGHTMEQDDPNAILLAPGETAEIVWTFAQPMDLEFACNVPGHYDAGMAGDFRFVDKLASR